MTMITITIIVLMSNQMRNTREAIVVMIIIKKV
jgi:hypothetical protein